MAPDASNPFLIPPPPPGTVVPTRGADAAPAIEVPRGFEAAPPVTTNSATHRIATPTTPVATVDSEKVVFFPAVPGAPAGVNAKWQLGLPDGRVIPVARAVFIGRNPARTADRPGADLLPLDDPDRSLSKTHALLELDKGALWVHDLDSTNGVVVAAPGVEPVIIEPGSRQPLQPGSELRLGSYVARVARTD